MTYEEAIKDAVAFADLYTGQDSLNDSQAARIGRTLWSNLKQVERDNKPRD